MTQAAAHSVALSALLCVGMALSGCATMGTGSGSISPDAVRVVFTWKSTDGGMTGTMQATLENGQIFSGRYVESAREVTEDSDIVSETLGRGWVEWGGDSPHWDGWTPDTEDLATQDSGWVMANLQAADGQSMRCQFQLDAPLEGMGGGGKGECQLENGRSVDAVFRPQRTHTRGQVDAHRDAHRAGAA